MMEWKFIIMCAIVVISSSTDFDALKMRQVQMFMQIMTNMRRQTVGNIKTLPLTCQETKIKMKWNISSEFSCQHGEEGRNFCYGRMFWDIRITLECETKNYKVLCIFGRRPFQGTYAGFGECLFA